MSMSVFSKSTFDKKGTSVDKEESESESESDNPFLRKNCSKIDDSFDIVFEDSNKKSVDKQFDAVNDDTSSGGVVFEDSNADVDISKKSKAVKSKMSKFAQFNENQSSLDDSSQVRLILIAYHLKQGICI
jgi:hypothetical protein